MISVVERVTVHTVAPERVNASFVAVHAQGVAGWYGPVTAEIGAYVEQVLSSAAVGEPIMDHQRLSARLHAAVGRSPTPIGSSAVGAVDCAVWDLHGLLVGAPVKDLLAHSSTDSVVLYASWLGLDISSPAARGQIDSVRNAGWLFTKWGLRSQSSNNIYQEAKRLDKVASDVVFALGEAAAFDAVFTWNPALTEVFAEQMNSENFLWLEDPLPDTSSPAYRPVASKFPLAIGERLPFYMDGGVVLDLEPRAFTFDVVACGGLTRAISLVAAAQRRGVAVYPHGRAFIPALQLAAAYPDAIPAVEYRLQWEPARQVAYLRPWKPYRGMINVPGKPGLGATPRFS